MTTTVLDRRPSPPSPRPRPRPRSPMKVQQSSSTSSSSSAPTTIKLKSKVNASATFRKTATVSTPSSTPPRPRSPYKPQLVRTHSRPASPVRNALSPTLPIVTTLSTPSTPDRGHYTFSEDSSEKARCGSISLHHAVSLSSLHARSASAIPPSSIFNRNENGIRQTGVNQGKVRAKVSALAQQAESLNASPKMRSVQPRVRVPSISSSVSLNSSSSAALPSTPVFYPITTATAAANPHRFATTRPSPPNSGRHHYLPFLSNDSSASVKTRSAMPIIDPVSISPPMHSPPASALSFSSQSSVSKSPSSYRTQYSADSQTSIQTFSSRVDAPEDFERRANGVTFEDLSAVDRISYPAQNLITTVAHQEANEEESTVDRKVKAEAKSNRKIADLEITNRSLMAINASLESAKHRQAREIRELRRKLRESRLILPPRAYRAFSASADHDDATEEDEDESGSESNVNGRSGDETYQRVKVMLELLLESGRRALESGTHDHHDGGGGGTKVLSADEVRSWRGSYVDNATDSEAAVFVNDRDNADQDQEHSHESQGPVPLTTPVRDHDSTSEEESEEAIIITSDAGTSTLVPPVHTTPSP